ncbi:MAG: DUF5803 family protein [Haloarculaceae archaeon]
MTRRYLVLAALAAALLLAGCSTGPREIPAKDLAGDATYDWDTDATVSFNLTGDQYTAIFEIRNRSSIEVYGSGTFGGDQPIDVEAIRFRFRNGTVVNANHSALTVVKQSKQTNVSLPARNGKLAYAGPRSGKEFRTPVFVEGSWEVTLPVSARVGIPFLSSVSPGGHDGSVADNRLTLRWENVTASSVHARWFLQFDLLLFSTLAVAALGLGIGGAVYYLRQIRHLERQRKEIGLDVEEEDDDLRDREPPPGMG